MRRVAVLALVLALVAVVAAGCGAEGVVAPTAQTVIGKLPTAAPIGKGDPAAGKLVYAANGCSGCHTFKPAGSNGKVGPNLDNLAADAKKANHGDLTPYTVESIKNPGAYVVPGYPNGVMPAFTSLTDKQLADLTAFLTQGH